MDSAVSALDSRVSIPILLSYRKALFVMAGDRTGKLKVLCELVSELYPGTGCIAYLYDAAEQAFDPLGRVAVGEKENQPVGFIPRDEGWGAQCIREQRVIEAENATSPLNPFIIDPALVWRRVFPISSFSYPLGVLYLDAWTENAAVDLTAVEYLIALCADSLLSEDRGIWDESGANESKAAIRRLRLASSNIASGSNLEEICSTVLENALLLTKAEYGILRLLDDDGRNLIPVAMSGTEKNRLAMEKIPLDGKSISAWVAAHGETLYVGDLSLDPWRSRYVPLSTGIEMRSELVVPLFGYSGKLEGVINLESQQKDAFDHEDSNLLQSLAMNAIGSIQETRLTDAILRINAMVAQQDLEVVTTEIFASICELTGAARCSLWKYGPEGARLVLADDEAEPSAVYKGHLIGDSTRENGTNNWVDGDLLNIFRSQPDVPAEATDCWTSLVGKGGGAELSQILCVYWLKQGGSLRPNNPWNRKILDILAGMLHIAILNHQRRHMLDEARARQASAELFAVIGDVSSNILHQVNNRIGIIPARIQAIQSRYKNLIAEHEDLNTRLGAISQNAVEALAVVRSNLDQLRSTKLEPVPVLAAIQSAWDQSQMPSGIELELIRVDLLPPLEGSKITLALIFQNLFENAARAMGGKGRIAVRGRLAGNMAVFDVIDDGPGVPAAKRNQLFDFNPQSDRQSANIGFGLWWVRTQLSRNGGSIRYVDRYRGACFRLEIPIAQVGGEIK